MLAGFGGHLVSTAYLESQLDTSRAGGGPASLRARRLACAFGPASSVRAIFDAGAVPLLAMLGFDPPSHVERLDTPAGAVLAATIGRHQRSIALVVTPWGARMDALWRTAVTEAMRRSAPWCLLFDGVRLRIVDAGRLYARRFVEFDLDLAIEHHSTFAALWRSASADALTAAPTDAQSLHALVIASDRHASGVCRSLRDGVVSG